MAPVRVHELPKVGRGRGSDAGTTDGELVLVQEGLGGVGGGGLSGRYD